MIPRGRFMHVMRNHLMCEVQKYKFQPEAKEMFEHKAFPVFFILVIFWGTMWVPSQLQQQLSMSLIKYSCLYIL